MDDERIRSVGDSHVSGRLACSPLINNSNVNSGLGQPVCTHEPSRAGTYDEDIYVGLDGHG